MKGHKRKRQPWIPPIKEGRESLDYSTPLDCPSTICERQKKRRKRGVSEYSMVMTKAMNVAFRLTSTDESSEEEDTKESRFFATRIELVMEGKGSEIKLSPSEKEESRCACALCTAPTSKMCICGYSLAGSHEPTQLNDFLSFVRKAPIYRMQECQDNKDFIKAYKKVVPKTCDDVGSAMSMALFAGSSGRPAKVTELGHHIVHGSYKDFQKGCTKGMMRGGQYNGTFPLKTYGKTLSDFSQHAVTHFKCIFDKMKRKSTVLSAFKEFAVMLTTNETCNFPKVDSYFNKKICEHLCLLSFAGRYKLKIEEAHLQMMAPVWPIPDHTFKALQYIFPGLVRSQARHAIRLLQKCMSNPPDFVTMVALLCFWDSPKFDWGTWC